jgi:predicted Zn-dependent protease
VKPISPAVWILLILLLVLVPPAVAPAVDDSGQKETAEEADSKGTEKTEEEKKKEEAEDAQEEEDEERKSPPVLSTEYDDRRVGKEEAEKVAAAMGIVGGPLGDYVAKVGARLARNAGHRFDYTFKVVDEDPPNAFALPGGYIFVSRGLLLLANSETELANVLGHEITHVTQRHAAARQQIVQGVPGFFQFMQFRSLAAYGRDQERTSDKLGQKIAAAAGYDPAGMAAFMKQLEFATRLERGSSRLPSYMDTHPSTGERVADNKQRAGRMRWTPKPEFVEGRLGYLELLNGLSVGLSASEGVFKRSRFMHPEMGFTVRFPDGWDTVNTHTAVGAIDPQKRAQVVLEFGGKDKNLRKVADEFREKSARNHLKLDEPQPVNLAGRQALRSRGVATTGRGSFHAVVTWIPWKDDVVFRITGLSLSRHHEGVFINTARSFRPITERELRQIKETRVRVALAEDGETLTALAKRVGNTWNVNTTAVMNGVHTTQRLEAGFPVKVAIAELYKPKSAAAAE